MWTLSPNDEYKKRLKKFEKKFRREITAVHANLNSVMVQLNEGIKPAQLQHGSIHREPGGVIAVDQKGGGSGLRQFRLYLFPDESSRQLYVLTIGTKERQNDEIRFCTQFVEAFRKRSIDVR